MTTSSTYAFAPAASDLVLNAFGRLQIRGPELTADHLNNAAMEAFLNGDPGPISDAEMAAMVDGEMDGEMPDGRPVCPNGHGPMADSNYGGFYCRT